MTLTFGSLFTGDGGFDLAFERAGMVCAWQVEIDEHCQAVLATHWPDVPRYEDVRDVGKDNLRPVDLICGGFPCQDVSVAGKREGLAGERSGLWFEFHRILAELTPRWVVIENVPGLLSSNSGRDFAILLGGLTGILPRVPTRGWGNAGTARGPIYSVAYRILDAQFFGVPQRRRRVFIVGHLGDGRAAQVLFERESGAWDPTPGRETGARVADPITASFARHRRASAGKDGYPHKVAPTITGHHPRYNGTDETLIAAQCHGSNVGPMGELRRGNGHLTGGVPFIAFDRTCATNDVCADYGVRRLTPTECERLQAFPDGWTAGQSDTQRYRQLGNAVCVSNAEWIGERIMEFPP